MYFSILACITKSELLESVDYYRTEKGNLSKIVPKLPFHGFAD